MDFEAECKKIEREIAIRMWRGEKSFVFGCGRSDGEGEMSLYGGFVHHAGCFDTKQQRELFVCFEVQKNVAEFNVKISSRL